MNTSMESMTPAQDKLWFVVHTYSGMEKAAERNIREQITRAGLQNRFGRILIPTEELVEVKDGKRRHTERRFYPGYILVEMAMDDETWHLVRRTNKVTGFVGGASNKPVPISAAEVDKIMLQMREGAQNPRHKTEFVVGEMVRIKEGPFAEFNGNVEEVNYERSKLRVTVTIFGRATPVELDFQQVEKT